MSDGHRHLYAKCVKAYEDIRTPAQKTKMNGGYLTDFMIFVQELNKRKFLNGIYS
jgi:hypothetical protein